MTRFCLPLLLIFLLIPLNSRAEDPAPPVPSDGKCLVPADDQWTAQEKFVWEGVCRGQIADFNEGPAYGGALDPRNLQGLPPSRILRSSFVETILLKDTYRRALTRQGVRVAGARFTEILDLQGADVGHDLAFFGCLFEHGANLVRLKSANALFFNGSRLIDFLRMEQLHLGTGLFMSFAVLDNVLLSYAHVTDFVDLSGASVTNHLGMHQLRTGAKVWMQHGRFAEINLVNAHIGGDVVLTGATVDGQVDADGLEVQGGALLGYAKFQGPVKLSSARIRGDVHLTDSELYQSVILRRAQIDGALFFGTEPKSKRVMLDLVNARADSIPGLADAWPSKLELEGFSYRSAEAAEAFEQWFAKLDHYAAQPYTQLASVVLAQGNNELATAIRYAGRDRERKELKDWAPWIWLTILWASIGYGYHVERALIWVVAFVVAGTVALWFSEQSWRNGLRAWSDKIVYSIDMLLPIIKLREKDYQIDLKGSLGYYFYFHKIMGYVLASFLIAGLSGLTK
jgi:hypothetical protein